MLTGSNPAWRGKIGISKATHRGRTLAFWYNTAPEGVEVITTAIGYQSGTRETFDEGLDRIAGSARRLADLGCTVVVVTGTPPFLLRGTDFELEWGRALAAELGVPVITPMLPHVLAMRALGLRKVAIASYYKEELNTAIVKYLAEFDIEGVPLGGIITSDASEELYSTPLLDLDAVSYRDVYVYCKRELAAAGMTFDGIYINGSGWEAAPAIDYLERDTGLPVIWAQAANAWVAYQKIWVRPEIEGYGQLLRRWPAVPVTDDVRRG